MLPIDIPALVIALLVLIFSLTVHEAAHAWSASRLGDDTARHLGRVSLNPVVHIDPIGTLLLPVLAMTTGAPVIGWAKPTPVNARHFRQPRRDSIIVTVAGPASNLAIAVAAAIALRMMPAPTPSFSEIEVVRPLEMIASQALSLNVLLAVFNLLPIPPLDGGQILMALLPPGITSKLGFLYRVRISHPARAADDGRSERAHRAALLSGALVAPVAGAKRVVSGMRPTGRLHLGHLVGALQNWVALQPQYDCFYFVADWHALTTDYADTSQLTQFSYDNAIDWIAAGLDPERSTLFVQSMVPEHAELALLLSMVAPVSWLERVPTYKEQQESLTDKDLSSIGFLGYPLLQTADVALYDGHFIPVGEDQVAHLELSREIVRRFNRFYGVVLVEPQPLLTKVARLPGLDGFKKMSKSLGNTILLSDDPETVKKKVRSMYTDPKRTRPDIPGTVEGNPVFLYHDVFNPDAAEVDDLKERYRAGRVGDVEVKDKLAKALNVLLDPMRERRREIAGRPERIHEILVDGSKRAGRVARETMDRVRSAVKIRY